jgi:hypothetical protein
MVCFSVPCISSLIVNRLGQRFTKKINLCKVVRHIYGMTPAQYEKVKEVDDLITKKPVTETLVNIASNYNGFKDVT